MNYIDALIKFHEVIQPANYVEIGCRRGKSVSLAKCASIAIDPAFEITFQLEAPTRLFRMTSDLFFETYNIKDLIGAQIDAAFIDGMHLAEYALRDFMNIEANCHPRSVIVIDDVMPQSIEWASRERKTQAWTGDVYKLVSIFLLYRPDLKVDVIDMGIKGMCFITRVNPDSTVLASNYQVILADILSDKYSYDSVEELRAALKPLGESSLPVVLEDIKNFRESPEQLMPKASC